MQQATCAHSGADTGTSSGNHDTIPALPTSRRGMLSGTLGIIGMGMLPTVGVAVAGESTFTERLATYRAKCAAYEACEDRGLSDGQADKAYSRSIAAYNEMMETPAPHAGAVADKLDALLHEMEGAEIEEEHLKPILRDLRMLAASS